MRKFRHVEFLVGQPAAEVGKGNSGEGTVVTKTDLELSTMGTEQRPDDLPVVYEMSGGREEGIGCIGHDTCSTFCGCDWPSVVMAKQVTIKVSRELVIREVTVQFSGIMGTVLLLEFS